MLGYRLRNEKKDIFSDKVLVPQCLVLCHKFGEVGTRTALLSLH